MRCAGLVLAAGAGSRLGRPKATVELGGQRLVDRAVETLRAGGLDPVVVVVGAVPVGAVDAVVVDNPEWATGLAGSLRAGLTALMAYDDAEAALEAVAVTLVDLPDITPEGVRRVVSVVAGGARAALATYAGVRSHPVVLRRDDWMEAATSATGDSGARVFVARHADEVVEVPCDDIGSGADIDTAADLQVVRARELWAGPPTRPDVQGRAVGPREGALPGEAPIDRGTLDDCRRWWEPTERDELAADDPPPRDAR